MIKVYSTSWCPGCVKLKKYLNSRGVEFEEINVADKHEDREEVFKVSGQRTVPVLEADGTVVVGFDKALIDEIIDNK
ncbi:MAG: glutathione S-transferase N-terminal domain-containing protein [Clostridium sp.]|uniref:glutaredoxin domain-containing protein n=1 Tax=Clostridium sp. DSM 8431 TaxID=1761781 RepID=UPI0008E76864|nr:glutaredoxin domain-containing protein [Clostridium sp. DSM 8431]MCR4943621.1 glutathione S-transferase N-terminal domain-containing protein [Clostridium sp.]SFU47659.1 Glutaredoxin-like protein, YruB-family [Clostridium sp. DSM 8431]